MRLIYKHMLLAASMLALLGCSKHAPIRTETSVDIERFMGDWYVIACIPTLIERGAHNAMESYRMSADGTIATTFSFRKGGFNGERKIYQPLGHILDRGSNAVWGMQFLWPFQADYRIVYVNDDYSQTIIGRQRRDYVWIMARTARIDERELERLTQLVADQGYDPARLQQVPQHWDSVPGGK